MKTAQCRINCVLLKREHRLMTTGTTEPDPVTDESLFERGYVEAVLEYRDDAKYQVKDTPAGRGYAAGRADREAVQREKRGESVEPIEDPVEMRWVDNFATGFMLGHRGGDIALHYAAKQLMFAEGFAKGAEAREKLLAELKAAGIDKMPIPERPKPQKQRGPQQLVTHAEPSADGLPWTRNKTLAYVDSILHVGFDHGYRIRLVDERACDTPCLCMLLRDEPSVKGNDIAGLRSKMFPDAVLLRDNGEVGVYEYFIDGCRVLLRAPLMDDDDDQ